MQGRQGIVKVVYRGIIFAYDANEVENGGYFCFKSQICEKIKFSSDACAGKVVVSIGYVSLGSSSFISSVMLTLPDVSLWHT